MVSYFIILVENIISVLFYIFFFLNILVKFLIVLFIVEIIFNNVIKLFLNYYNMDVDCFLVFRFFFDFCIKLK